MLRRTLISAAIALAIVPATPAFAEDAINPEEATMPEPSQSGHASVNGVELYYAVYGEGDPLILLHGGFGQIEMFGPNIAALAEGRQVIGVDLRGHGRTPLPEEQMTFSDLAADVAGLMEHLGLEKADVMGYSLGGSTAIRLAIEHPEVVDKLVVASTSYAYSGWHDFNQEGMRQLSGATTAGPMKQTSVYEAYAALQKNPEADWPRFHDQMGRLLVSSDYDWSAEIPKIKSPVMLVFGDWDAIRTSHTASFFELLGGGKQDAQWDRSGMNQNRLAIVPNHTHYELIMSPALAEVVIPFLDAE